ncbi:MAG: long-chain fatty acid--CoA ligase [Bdellovibrionales bacterium]|nr:long-chain fatty acid--CoA ligase [Bdellovibrionales bacterium]
METIAQWLLTANTQRPDLTAIRNKKKGQWQEVKWSDFYLQVETLAGSLAAMGLKPGDKVGLISNTRWEWMAVDVANLCSGLVTVPIYQSNRKEDIEHILNDSEAQVLFVEDAKLYKVWKEIAKSCPHVKKVICISPYPALPDEDDSWDDFVDLGTDFLAQNKEFLKQLCNSRTLDEDATLIYTSGTTGLPKGVLLTHRQISSEITEVFDLFDITPADSSLSFLPYAHVMGRIESWGCIYKGYTLNFAESIERIRKNLIETKPTILIAVPRIFEKIYAAVATQVETHPLKSKIFEWSLDIGKKVSQATQQNKRLSPVTMLQYKAAKALVFDTLNQEMGGQIRFAISGGAPLERSIAEFFHAAGLLLLEGYGLTETTAAICVNRPDAFRFGTVGKPVGDVDIKLAEDGEILVKSDKVMKEYYKNPEATEKVFQDGYFVTGDIGVFEDGFLKITDRKKDLIKTAGGKYVAPQKLENLLKLSRFISNVLIYGDRQKYIVALITLDEEQLLSHAKEQGWSFQSFETLSRSDSVFELVRKAVAETNSNLASFETIKNFAILERDFTIEAGELTPSMKVKRKTCAEKFQDVLDGLYH